MKNSLLTLVVCLLIIESGYAGDYPVDKGSTIISGAFSVSNSSGELYEDGEGNSATVIILNPGVLNFVIPNLALGTDFAFAYAKQGDESATVLEIGPKFLYFVGGPDSKAYSYFGMGLNLVKHSSDDYNSTGTKFKIGAGVSLMVANHLGVFLEGTYSHDNFKPDFGKSESGNVLGIAEGLAGFLY